VKRRPKASKRLLWATQEQAEALIANLPVHLKRMARFSLATGARQFNVTHLEWVRVDLRRKIAWIPADEAKGGKVLLIHLNDDALQVIKEAQADTKRHKVWVFPFCGQAVDNPVQVAYKNAVAAAGLPPAFNWQACDTPGRHGMFRTARPWRCYSSWGDGPASTK
jgi:integrase